MTYENRKKWLCQQCGKPQQCGYVDRNLDDKCPAIQEKMEGWELGYKDAIDKACEFLQSCEGYVVSGVKCNYDNFIKFMEEQQ